MAMDVRDVFFWAREAKRRCLIRRMEAYTAGLLPHQETSNISSVMSGLMEDIEAIDQDEDAIEKADKENARLIAEANRMVKARRERRKAQRAAGIVPTPKKKRRLPKKAKVIR
jgi:hypothetical protein